MKIDNCQKMLNSVLSRKIKKTGDEGKYIITDFKKTRRYKDDGIVEDMLEDDKSVKMVKMQRLRSCASYTIVCVLNRSALIRCQLTKRRKPKRH